MSRELILVPREKFQKMLEKIDNHNVETISQPEDRDNDNHNVETISQSEDRDKDVIDTPTQQLDRGQLISDDKQNSEQVIPVDESTPERWGVKRTISHFVRPREKTVKRRKWTHLSL